MTKKILPVFLLAFLISFSAQLLIASDDDYYEDEYDDNRSEHVYGWELMTDDELAAHREKMRSLESREERWEYRKEHHQKMLERAKKEDVYLRDCPRPGKRGKGYERS
jgi:flagellar motility protein MotE (MotC chaperone)